MHRFIHAHRETHMCNSFIQVNTYMPVYIYTYAHKQYTNRDYSSMNLWVFHISLQILTAPPPKFTL